MERIAAVLVESTPLVRRSWRFVLVDFLVRMWRRYAAPRLMLPLPRTLNLLAAPFFVFIFGMTSLFSYDAGRFCGYAFHWRARTLEASAITWSRYAAAGFVATFFSTFGFS